MKSTYQNWSLWRQKSVEHRLERLESDDADEVRDVILSFIDGNLPQRALSPISEQTKHPEDSVRAASVCALGGLQSQVGSNYVLHALRDPSIRVRMAGVYLLTGRSDLWSECRGSLPDLFDDTSLDVRIESFHLGRRMGFPDFAGRVAAGLEEDARMGRIANFAARRDALEAITGQQQRLYTPYVFGQPPHGDALRVARVELACRWQDWLSENWAQRV